MKKKLSKRELEMLQALKDGKRNKEAAQQMNVSEKTVGTYKLRLITKLGLMSRDNDYKIVTTATKLGIL